MVRYRRYLLRMLRMLVTLLLTGLAVGIYGDMRDRFLPIIQKGTLLPRSLLISLAICLTFIGLILLQTWQPHVFIFFNRLRSTLGRLRWGVALVVAVFTSWFFLFTKWSEVFSGFYLRLVFFLLTLWFMTWLATRGRLEVMNWHAFLIASVLFGSVFTVANALTSVVGYPFGLFWSEGNRIWDYSVLYGRGLYNYPLDQTIPAYIDLGRQSLWGLPFLFPGVTITAVRLWSAFLFTIPYVFLGWFVFYKMKDRLGLWFLAGLWTMLFLNQGPIYTPLVWIAILVVATRWMSLWAGALVVILASYYAIFSRSTWMFAPGIWAAVIAFIEADPKGVRTVFQRWMRAIVFGLAGLFGSNLLQPLITYIRNYGQGVALSGATQVGAAMGAVERQPLLWDRLFPSSTYPAGILLALLMAAGPLILLLIVSGIRGHWRLNLWQKLALWGSSLAFLVVGVIVSVKIGGGNNLHNLDMFLISLVLVAGLAWEAGVFSWVLKPVRYAPLLYFLLLLTLFVPASQNMMTALPRGLPSQARADEALSTINEAISNVDSPDRILFIDQRQLLTFGFVPRIPLIPEYEKKRMMDEAMAENAAYFAPFIRDLSSHRFSLIISEPLWIKFQGSDYHFGNENDAWVKWVSIPVLCYYQPVETFLDVGVQLLVPRWEPLEEPGIICPQL